MIIMREAFYYRNYLHNDIVIVKQYIDWLNRKEILAMRKQRMYLKPFLSIMIIAILVLSIPVKSQAEGYVLGGFDVSQYTLKQLEDAGFIRYFFILDHEGNETAGYYKSAEEIAYAGHIRCFVEFNPRPFIGTIYDADNIRKSADYSYDNPAYIFANSLTQYDPAVLDIIGYTVWEIHFDAYPGIDPTQFTLPTLETAGYMTRISNSDYLYLRKNNFQIRNVILYDKYCYISYTFQVLNQKMPAGPSRYGTSRLILPGYLSYIPNDYDEAHGIPPSLSYTADHEVPIHSDHIGIPDKPLVFLSR